MFYRLCEPWSFRGWQGIPYAIRAEEGKKASGRPYLFEQEAFLDLLACNGEEDINPAELSTSGQKCIQELADRGVMQSSAEPLPPLSPWQRYRVYPARYLDSVHWSITGKCNFHCRHCLVSAPDAHLPQLPLHDILHIVDEIANAGVKRVDITGGEPLLRQDFEAIVEALSKAKLVIGVLFTNASLLDSDVLDMLERNGQHPTFQLSFDGLGHHDWLRGVPGSEEQADAAFRLLQERGYYVNAAMCIHRENRDCLRDTANYLASLGVQTLRVNAPMEFGTWKRYAKDYALSDGEVWEIYRDFIPEWIADGMPIGIDLDGFFHCAKGSTDYRIGYAHNCSAETDFTRIPYCESVRFTMHIGPDGRALPCMSFSDSALNESFPSVVEQHLGEITLAGSYHDAVETKVADLIDRNPECATCEHLPDCCGGCMAQDMTDDGDFLVPEARCCFFWKHVGKDAVRDVVDAAIAAS